MLSSIIRTVTPIIVGWLLGLPVVAALGITDAQATAAVSAVLGAAYYVLVRVVEVYYPRFGWLLGLASAPSYPARHRASA